MDDPSKYPGITVFSSVGKVFEDIITKKLQSLFMKEQSQLLFGFTAWTSICLHPCCLK